MEDAAIAALVAARLKGPKHATRVSSATFICHVDGYDAWWYLDHGLGLVDEQGWWYWHDHQSPHIKRALDLVAQLQ